MANATDRLSSRGSRGYGRCAAIRGPGTRRSTAGIATDETKPDVALPPRRAAHHSGQPCPAKPSRAPPRSSSGAQPCRSATPHRHEAASALGASRARANLGGPSPRRRMKVPDTGGELLAIKAARTRHQMNIEAFTAPSMRLTDVGGIDEVKRRLEGRFSTRSPMPSYGPVRHGMRGGLLLYGPPGCRQDVPRPRPAGEVRAGFVAVSPPTCSTYGSAAASATCGDVRHRPPEPTVHAVLRWNRCHRAEDRPLRRAAPPCGASSNQPPRRVRRGQTSDNRASSVVTATDRPWDINPALFRPGRFDRTAAGAPANHGHKRPSSACTCPADRSSASDSSSHRPVHRGLLRRRPWPGLRPVTIERRSRPRSVRRH